MKRIVVCLIWLALAMNMSAQKGSDLWLQDMGSTQVGKPELAIGQRVMTPTLALALEELKNIAGVETMRCVIDPTMDKEEYDVSEEQLTAGSDLALLYAAFDVRRTLSQGKKIRHHHEKPFYSLRLLNHWDNLDGSVERGYAGKSIWKWEEIDGDGKTMSRGMEDRVKMYARANASIGINGSVLNNVNASPKMLSTEYLKKVAVLADRLRPYGIKTFLSINFASPMALGYTDTADPLNADVQKWWVQKVDEIYRLIPDFGGFLVKANSEGQPGPGDYHRTHADGANMLAKALKPHQGIVMWRSFVYGANHKGEDRVMQAVSEFKPMDGLFDDNVILQSKNGPLDFHPREPYAPIFDNITKTPQMVELQITQEYLGQSLHLVYLGTMWKEFFSFVEPSRMMGIAGVANIGDTEGWCGHPFSQANWYAFGRLAWNPYLSEEEIAREWVLQTFPTLLKDQTMADVEKIVEMMMDSREACVDYMMPLGLHHIFKFDHHYGPEPDGFKADYPIEWCPVYYHKADKNGVGFDRSSAGTGAVNQYRAPYSKRYDDLATCPEEYLLWFHHVAWDYKMHNGKTLWDNLKAHYEKGVAEVDRFRQVWQQVRGHIDAARAAEVAHLLDVQYDNAVEWRDTCLGYFGKFIE